MSDLQEPNDDRAASESSTNSHAPITANFQKTTAGTLPSSMEIASPKKASAARKPRRRQFIFRRGFAWMPWALFLVTAASVALSGSYLAVGLSYPLTFWQVTGEWLWPSPGMWTQGMQYAACLLAILGAHEAGHYLQARRHRVPATLPLFIPFPFSPFGTMGAVIVQRGGIANKRQLFDIAVSGPLAGLVIALPMLAYGISTTHAGPVGQPVAWQPYVEYGHPLIMHWMIALIHGPLAPGTDIALNPALFAGWVGVFITALNLLPVGQLDGGHLLFTMIGRRARFVALAVLLFAVGWMLWNWQFDYALIVLLLLVFGRSHPPTADDRMKLGWPRFVLGTLTLAFIVIGMTPRPVIAFEPLVVPTRYVQPTLGPNDF